MEPNIEVNIAYEESEIKKAIAFYLWHIRGIRTRAMIIYPIVTIVIVFSIVFHWFLPLFTWTFAGFMFHFGYYKKLLNGYVNVYKKRKGGLYNFGNEKVSVVGEEIQCQYAWSVFKKAYETAMMFQSASCVIC